MPTFFVAGTPKGGTNALISALATHPEVFVPADLKEPMFFFWHGCDVEYRFVGPPPVARDHHRNLDAYQRIFSPGKGKQAIGEGSVHYFASERAAGNIRSIAPESKIIVMLRDPVERALSHYSFNVMRGLEDRPFEAAIEQELAGEAETLYPTYRYVGNGFYGRHLSSYLTLFPRDQVLVMLFEDFVADRGSVITRAESFLDVRVGGSDVDAGFQNETVSGGGLMALNRFLRTSDGWLGTQARRLEQAAGGNRSYRAMRHRLAVMVKRTARRPAAKPELSDETRQHLEQQFQGDAHDLARLSGLDLGAWRSLR